MGFLRDMIRSVGRAVGSGIEKIGDFVGSETLSDIGWSIQDACAERVASEKSYNKKEANIYTTDRLNKILISFSEDNLQKATSIEQKCIKLVEEYYDKLIDLIEAAPGSAHSASNLKALKNGKRRIANTITGGIKEPLAKRMSLDDSECLRILKMDSGDDKKRAMTNFTKKVINEALNNLSKKVRVSLNDQTGDIQDYLNGISEEQEKAMQAMKERYDKMISDGESEQSDKEKHCVMPLYITDATQCICDILG